MDKRKVQKMSEGCNLLAKFYSTGEIEKNIDAAIKWIEISEIDSENFIFYCNLLLLRSNDEDVSKVVALLTSDPYNIPESSLMLSRLYRDGKGVPKDIDKAIELMENARSKNVKNIDLEYVDLIFKKNKRSDLPKAIAILEEGAKSNDPEYCGRLARAYRDGKGVPKDIDKAIELMYKAYEGGVKWARNELFDILISSTDSDKQKQAIDVISDAVSKNDPYAKIRMARAYRDGKGVPKDIDKAIELIQDVNINKNDAKMMLIELYLTRSKPDDLNKAFRMANQLAEAGDPDAMNILGQMYRDGIYVNRDAQKALFWLNKATSSGGN